MNEKDMTNQTPEQDINVSHRHLGEQIFTILMSLSLVALIVFYVSLPVRLNTYETDSNSEELAPEVTETPEPTVDPSKEDVTPEVETPEVTTDEAKPETETPAPTPEETKPETETPAPTPEEPVTEPEPEAPKETTADGKPLDPAKSYAKITYDGLNIREGATVNTDVVGKADLNAIYELVDVMSELEWAKIIFDGKEAYAHVDFIEIIEAE